MFDISVSEHRRIKNDFRNYVMLSFSYAPPDVGLETFETVEIRSYTRANIIGKKKSKNERSQKTLVYAPNLSNRLQQLVR